MFNFAHFTLNHMEILGGWGWGEASVIWWGGKLPLCPPSLYELNCFHSPKLNEGAKFCKIPIIIT